jgi:ABC-type transporter MlaC component
MMPVVNGLKSMILAAGLALGVSATALAADTASWARDFVVTKTAQVQTTLSDGSLTPQERADQFNDQMGDAIDIDRIARFVLGSQARSISDAEFRDFADAYRDYALNNFQTQLQNYADANVNVLNTFENKPDDQIVRTRVTSDRLSQPLSVNWRVVNASDPKLVDVEVAGAWLMLSQRAEITSLLRANNNDVEATAARLRAQAKF